MVDREKRGSGIKENAGTRTFAVLTEKRKKTRASWNNPVRASFYLVLNDIYALVKVFSILIEQGR